MNLRSVIRRAEQRAAQQAIWATQTASSGSGLTAEDVRDTVAAFLTAGANVTLTHNDGADTLTVAAAGVANEQIDDRVAALLTAGANITLTYDDAANTLTVAATVPAAFQVKAATITVPYGVYRARVTVSDAAVTGSSRILVQPAGPLNTDENDPEMDAVTFTAIAASGAFDVIAASASRIGGSFRLLYTVG